MNTIIICDCHFVWNFGSYTKFGIYIYLTFSWPESTKLRLGTSLRWRIIYNMEVVISNQYFILVKDILINAYFKVRFLNYDSLSKFSNWAISVGKTWLL